MYLRRPSLLHLLRQERIPLAALAGLSLLAQILIVALTLATTPAISSDLGLLCQPSLHGKAPITRHDPAKCVCGPVCPHGAKLLATEAAAPVLRMLLPREFGETCGSEGALLEAMPSGQGIRGPPLFSI